MGLDMYLSKKIYVQNWDHHRPEQRWDIQVKHVGEPVNPVGKLSYLTYQVAYWRKANAIHKWFVEHCQGGRDECQESAVESHQLQELLGLCRSVVDQALMQPMQIRNGYVYNAQGEPEAIFESGSAISNPQTVAQILPTEGGFFFGSTDYDQYYMQDIKHTITQLEAALADPVEGEFYYQASW